MFSRTKTMQKKILAIGFAMFAAPAAADVIELKSDGSVHVLVSDGEMPALPEGSSAPGQGPAVPSAAMTIVAGSSAPQAYAPMVEKVAELNHLSPALLEALVWQESRWRAGARSRAGAIGLAQLMPGTARDLGVNPYDSAANLAGGARYLRQQLDRFGGDVERALAAYNAGPGRVLRAGGIPEIAETKAYVRAVVDRLSSSSLAGEAKP